MPVTTHSTANQWPPINASFDRQSALPALLRACYRPSTKRGSVYYSPYYRLFDTVYVPELEQACQVAGLNPEYIKSTPLGLAFDEFNPNHEQLRSALLWLLKRPEAVKNIVIVRDILHDNTSEPFYIGDLLTCQPATPSCQLPRSARSRKKHDLIITYLTVMKCAPLHDLEQIISGDCRKILLDLRGLGYRVEIDVQGLGADLEIIIHLKQPTNKKLSA
jgi:hypothetical protein